MYEATKPIRQPNFSKDVPGSLPPTKPILSSLFSQLPITLPKVSFPHMDKKVEEESPRGEEKDFAYKICNIKLTGQKADVSKHSDEQMEPKVSCQLPM